MKFAVRALVWTGGVLVCVYLIAYVAFTSTPWPSALLIRRAFDTGAARASERLAPFVPSDVDARLDVPYDSADPQLTLDVYRPRTQARASLLTVVWVHGGGWISGSKADIANYAKILAARGFAVAVVDYRIAPAAVYPQPVRDVDTALGFLWRHAAALHLDRKRFVLAGDSAGAQIAAQVAALVREPAYAKKLRIAPSIPGADVAGVLLYCGPYSTRPEGSSNAFSGLVGAVLWAYSGTKAPQDDAYFQTASVSDYVTSAFPPAFISAGNGDPLLAQSRSFAQRLQRLGVPVDTLFFPSALQPPLPHEYQFDLTTRGGRLALGRSVAFLERLWVQAKP